MEANCAINFDPDYQEVTMQDFVINQAKTRQQHADSVKEDSLHSAIFKYAQLHQTYT